METARPQLSPQVRRLLSGRTVDTNAAADLCSLTDTHIRLLAQSSLPAACRTARQFARRASTLGGPFPLAAERTLARVLHQSGNHKEAEKAYLRARTLAAHDLLVQARLDRSLVDLYMYLDNVAESGRRAKSALRTFHKLGLEADAAMTSVNFANVLHRQDRHREALPLYRDAYAYFTSTNDELSIARTAYNMANSLVQLFEFEEAEPLYHQSETLYKKHQYGLDATDARYGLAWLLMLRGDFHHALKELSTCEHAYQSFGHERGVLLCIMDRSEVFLGLNLADEAYRSARQAWQGFRQLKLRYESAKASLFWGQSALLLGKRTEAKRMIERAKEGFSAEQNIGFMGSSLIADASATQDPHDRVRLLREAARVFRSAQLPLWQAVSDLQLVAEPNQQRAAFARLEQNRAVQLVPHMYAAWQTSMGDIAERKGNTRVARRHWTNAATRLDLVRSQLPPIELRNSYARNRLDPHRRLIGSYLSEDPLVAAGWIEQLRTSGLWSILDPTGASASQRERVIHSLHGLASEVAHLARHLGSHSGERGRALGIERSRRLRSLETQVREQMAAFETESRDTGHVFDESIASVEQVAETIPIIQFYFDGTDLVALLHHRGKISPHRYANGRARLSEAMRQWRFLLERELYARHLPSRASLTDEIEFFARISAWLFGPLTECNESSNVLIIPDGELHNLPWSALMWQGVRSPVTARPILAPSVRHYRMARNRQEQHTGGYAFVGVADDLPFLQREIDSLSGTDMGGFKIANPAKRNEWLACGSARTWHYAGHARFRSDNPFYSFLDLADGPLFAADFRLVNASVDVVTLAACRTGEQVTAPDEEPSGFVRSLLEMGARTVIAGHWPVADISTALWMKTFYTSYREGCGVAKSMQDARNVVRESFPSAYHWAAFSAYGAVN